MKCRIFISGVRKELKAERLAVQEMVENDVLLKDYFKNKKLKKIFKAI